MFHDVEAVVKLSNLILQNGTQNLMVQYCLLWQWGKKCSNAAHFKFVRGYWIFDAAVVQSV